MLSWSANKDFGVWWLGIGRWRLILRAPWDEPLFSECYGHASTLPLGFGWRIQSRLVPVWN